MRKALQIAGMSISALFGNWARSALTTLGIVIAVAALPSVSAASPNVSVTLPIEGAGYSFSGVDPSYQEIASVELETGRFVEGDNELVLTAAPARELLNSGPEASVGETVTLGGEEYEVV